MNDARLRLVSLLVTATLFMEMLDGSVILTALPAMARAFGVEPIDLNLGISLYLLALGVFVPLSGWIADRIGARTVFATAICAFTVASALCGIAQSSAFFIAMRVVQGAAGAMMVPVGRLVVMRVTPREQLMDRLSMLIWPALVAPILGPPLGGVITVHLGWRWIFYLNIPVGALALIATFALIPNVSTGDQRRFDLIGFLLMALGSAAVLLAVERAGDARPSAGLPLLTAGIALLTLCWLHLRRSRQPLINIEPFLAVTFRTCVRGGTINRAAIGSVPFIVPLLLQAGFGLGADRAGLFVLCIFAGNLAMKAFTSPLIRRYGFKRVLIVNGLIAAASIGCCATLDRSTPWWFMAAIFVWTGAARSVQFTAFSTLAFADVTPSRMSDANSAFSAILQLTGAASIAAGTLGIRLGATLSERVGASFDASDYRIAFILMAMLSLIGLIDAACLPPQAGAGLIEAPPKLNQEQIA